MTELGWIPEEWELSSLINLSINGIKNGVFNDPIKVGSGYRIINVQNLYDEPVINTKKLELVNIDKNTFSKNKIISGDIFFTRSSLKLEGIAHCNICIEDAEDITYDGHIMKITPNTDFIIPIFLKMFCNTLIARKFFLKNAKQTTMTTIGQNDIAFIQIPIPTLPEQKKIADILSTWDSAIETTEKLIESKKKLKQGLMQKLLTGKMRFKEFEFEKWETVNLGEVTELFSRRNKKLNGARIYSVTNNNGFVFQSDHFSREVAGDDLSNYKIIKKNEFAYNPARINIGSIAHFKDEIGVISSLYVCFRTTKDLLDEYMYYLLQIESTKFKIRNFGEGGVRVYLWYPLFATIKVKIPNINEQKKISDSLQFWDKEIEILTKQLTALKEQKNGLMQVLLTGKIRVMI
ncbi:MAG: restriction endonuclease subunit S [Candidatus Kapabacteria bacterium]|nr:restriction endonuclease subunit S [Candidatus Kapabacteria bacterium]